MSTSPPKKLIFGVLGRPDVAHFAPFALGALVVAALSIRAILHKVGHPAALLDDSYIHFQYARALAEGHPFRFQAGEPISTGATSLLWPVVLAPFYLVGFRDEAILWPAWILAYVAFALLLREVYELLWPLIGRVLGACGALLVLVFGGLVWCAASGMEVVPFSWAIVATTRGAIEWGEKPSSATSKRLFALTALATTAVLLRPEGWAFAVGAAAVVVLFPRSKTILRRLEGALVLVPSVLVSGALSLAAGGARSNTAMVKLLFGNPYYQGEAFFAAVSANLHTFVQTLLQGRVWAAEFIPEGSAGILLAGLVATIVLGWRERRLLRALGIVLLALGMLIPCMYYTFLWNRLRYLWPFAPGWLMGTAVLGRALGDLLGAWRRRWRVGGAVLASVAVGVLASKLPGVLDDVADSASGIDRQQAHLGRWAKMHLPRGARIGVNDTGAIAYFSDRKTFDIVGLTTSSEPKYWVAGVGSRFEHYERLHRTNKDQLPDHFIVYPEWFGFDGLLGEHLYEAVVRDSTILGGTTMRVVRADYSLLGTGDVPWSTQATWTDELDVADLESESEHGYELLGAREGSNVVMADEVPSAGGSSEEVLRTVADGGRAHRLQERFFLRNPRKASVLVVRWMATTSVHAQATVTLDGVTRTSEIDRGAWSERAIDLPEVQASDRLRVQVVFTAPVTVFHYWVGR